MRRSLSLFKLFAILAALMVGAAGMGLSAIFLYLNPQLPSVDTLKDVRLATPLRVYTIEGDLIGEFSDKRRSPVLIQQVPQDFINAFLAAEDDRFYSHPGVDITGLARAALELVQTGSIQSGGSTITMQVAKNYLLSNERTFSRKFKEIFLSLEMERSLTKDQILELYLNKIFLGNRAYGVGAAAQVYYNKRIEDLSIAQMAMIAGLPKAPSRYNPVINPERAKTRRDWILARMRDLDYIDKDQFEVALASPITARYHNTSLDTYAPYVAEMVRLHMLKTYGEEAYEGGYRVFTTIKTELQDRANEAVLEGVKKYDERHGYRGAEARVKLPEPLPTDLTPITAELEKYDVIKDWHPAIVLSLEDKRFTALIGSGEVVEVNWEGIEGTRKYLTVDRRTRPVSSARDLVAVGDVVRLVPTVIEPPPGEDDASQATENQVADNSEQAASPEDNAENDAEAAPPARKWRLSQLPLAQAALVSLNADTGAIQALVGGYDYVHSSFNRVTQAKRQPGSNFTPFIYAAAMENGMTAATVINDAPIVFEDASLEGVWRPSNDSGKFDGPTRFRKALYKSRNLVSIRILRQIGIRNAIDYSTKFGFAEGSLPRDLSLALGSTSQTPLDVVTGYAAFANGGYKVDPFVIARIEDYEKNVIYQARPKVVCNDCLEGDTTDLAAMLGLPEQEELSMEEIMEGKEEREPLVTEIEFAEQIMDDRVAYIMDSILRDVVRKGTGRRALKLGRNDVAGKTGTTNGPTDTWFSGYAGGVVTTAWVGFDGNGMLGRKEYGGSTALPIWMDYMEFALDGVAERDLPQPGGLVTVRIDPETGELASPGLPDAIFETFREEQAPSISNTADAAPAYSTIQQEEISEEIF